MLAACSKGVMRLRQVRLARSFEIADDYGELKTASGDVRPELPPQGTPQTASDLAAGTRWRH